jgi:UDP-N-acetylmuramate dehydrogenase
LGGVAEYFAEPTNEEELVGLVNRFREQELPIRMIGGGSNVLVRDEGTPGLVIRLSAPAFAKLECQDQTIVAGGGVQLTHMISLAVREGLSGPEQLVGIPGTVGGALHHNSGTHGGAIGQWLKQATVLTRTGERKVREGNDLSFGYRQSSLNELAILSASFQFDREDSLQLTKRMQKLWIVCKSKQPTFSCNTGYIFKDAVGLNAAELIEQAGLKGTSIGKVEVSERDANFFVAHEGASSDDVLRLIDLVKSQVHERTGFELEVGINVW